MSHEEEGRAQSAEEFIAFCRDEIAKTGVDRYDQGLAAFGENVDLLVGYADMVHHSVGYDLVVPTLYAKVTEVEGSIAADPKFGPEMAAVATRFMLAAALKKIVDLIHDQGVS